MDAPVPAGGLVGGGLVGGGADAAALAAMVLASSEAPRPCVSAVLASTVASVSPSIEAASSTGLPSSMDPPSTAVTFDDPSPPAGVNMMSLAHPQGPTAAHARAATVTQ